MKKKHDNSSSTPNKRAKQTSISYCTYKPVPQEKLAYWYKVIESNPTDPKLYLIRGNIFFLQKGKLQLALDDYNQALALKPKYSDALQMRGDVFLKQGKLDQAITDFNEILGMEPNHYFALSSRGQAYFAQGKIDLALEDCNSTLIDRPGFISTLICRSKIFLRKNKFELALRDIREVISKQPRNHDALKVLSDIHYQKGEFSKGAIIEFDAFYKCPKNGNVPALARLAKFAFFKHAPAIYARGTVFKINNTEAIRQTLFENNINPETLLEMRARFNGVPIRRIVETHTIFNQLDTIDAAKSLEQIKNHMTERVSQPSS